jgi:hypothetical protein
MAKENGLGWSVLDVDDEAGVAQDIREDVNSLEFSTPRAVLEVTGIDKSAMERLHGLADFSATLTFTFDDDTSDSVHDVFKDLSNQRTLLITVSAQILTNEVLFTDYALSRGDDGAFGGTAPCVLANGTVPTWTT